MCIKRELRKFRRHRYQLTTPKDWFTYKKEIITEGVTEHAIMTYPCNCDQWEPLFLLSHWWVVIYSSKSKFQHN